MPHTLYVVATPIGNLEDMSFRAVRVLKEAGLIAAEDTRSARVLLDHYAIKAPVVSYHKFSEQAKLGALLQALEQHDVALISEAGMPGVSDPGLALVQEAIARGVRVVVAPGPSAVLTALVASGLPSDQFVYVGFLPREAKQRRALLQELASQPRTIVAFEAPHRIPETLADLREALGDRPIAVCRELTKLHEEVFRGTAEAALAHFQEPRGEFTLVIAGGAGEPTHTTEMEVEEALRTLKARGMTAREAVGEVSRELGAPRKQTYQAWLKLSEDLP